MIASIVKYLQDIYSGKRLKVGNKHRNGLDHQFGIHGPVVA